MCTTKASEHLKFETLAVTVPKPFVFHVELNRPDKLNALSHLMWIEIKKCFEALSSEADCRVVVVSAAGRIFTAGLDIKSATNTMQSFAEANDIARKAKILEELIRLYQQSMSSLEICKKPVLTGIHSACIGAGVDLITSADIRYCTNDAWFQVKEVDIGMAADVGTLQRLPRVIGSESLARELCFTARKFSADEAFRCGLVSKVFDDKESMLTGLLKTAEEIASKSPVAVQGTKSNIIYSRDHTVQEGLERMIIWNQFMMQSEDFVTALVGQATKDDNIMFSKL
ncbi:delta(3,5)-Delta(2,4)-dienoyl-CoA isomerase, mitochondrial isoform X2 [Agrilus planipennis]|nr:delta(3,5)-Delta(2,4)-dienoyl-CoA isomerase, mitochondrial isoform X2 [Agrilus planipennis]